MEYCDDVSKEHPDKKTSIDMIKDNFDNYIRNEEMNGRYPTTEDLKDKMEELIHMFMIED